MTRDELIEAMARAHYANYFEGLEDVEPAFSEQPESHQDRMREAMKAALAAIEAQGMAIVPVEATDAMLMAGADYSCYGDIAKAYDYMIEAGKL